MADKAVTVATAASKEVALKAMSTEAVIAQVAQVQEIMHKVMREGEHYGVIPGTKKPSLLKAGAEKLSFTFRLLPKYRITARDLPGGHREYEVVCELWHESGVFAGEGVGNCSTMESKYRWRGGSRKCPSCGSESIIKGKAEYGGGWICFKRKGGCGTKFHDDDTAITGQAAERQENPDVADAYNTVLKMAKKRAHVDAAITACAASDIFTQDVADDETPAQDEPRVVSRDRAAALRDIKALVEKHGVDGDQLVALRKKAAAATTAEQMEALLSELTAEMESVDSAAEAGFAAAMPPTRSADEVRAEITDLVNGTEYLEPAERKSYLASAQSIRSVMNLEALKGQLEKLIDDRTPLDVGTLAVEPAPDKPGAE